ncbi:hypothetical protein [Fictibacillus sp. S7]|uniref:hypothetical protein n=1 Tax=Fictibacillus sp. S7 TaxID=2212476 RepID=UPI0010101DD0|nr:hypothetical protein [Fictibacillus sp. S7]RXY98557.1 hypothetical protein DMO16_02115 [Fictibacillus sp. S7]
MEVTTIKYKHKKREWPDYIIKARQERKEQKEMEGRLKNGDLYDMKELERRIYTPDYYMKERQSYRDAKYLERLKYYKTPEGQMREQEIKYSKYL